MGKSGLNAARPAGDRALWLAVLGAIALGLAFPLFLDASKHIPLLAQGNPFAEDPYDAVGSIGMQVAAVVAGLTALRAWHRRRENPLSPRPRSLLLRGAAIVLLAVGLSLGADWAGVVASGSKTTLTPLFAILAILSALTIQVAIFLAWATLSPPEPAAPAPDADADSLDDLFFLIREVRDVAVRAMPALGRIWERGAQFVLRPPVAAWIEWFNPRRHLVRSVTFLAALAGLGLAVSHAALEGTPADLFLALEIGAFFFVVEMIAALAGYFLFGRFLGIVRREA